MYPDIDSALGDWRANVVKFLSYNDVSKLPEYALQLSRIIAFPDLDIQNELGRINQMGHKIHETTKNFSDLRPTQIIEKINDQLYRREKFKPNKDDYYNPLNSFLNVVLKRKVGIPITLSLLYLGIADFLSFKLYPVNFPSHFLIKHVLEGDSEIIIDPYNEGRIMDDYSLKQLLDQTFLRSNVTLTKTFVEKTSVTSVILRMLNNLKSSYFECQDIRNAELVNEMILTIDGNDQYGFRDRGMILLKNKRREDALNIFNEYVEKYPEADDIDPILDIIRKLKKDNNIEI
jgi:regulator of sirC expression with transglutaminase-like and TPR domain